MPNAIPTVKDAERAYNELLAAILEDKPEHCPAEYLGAEGCTCRLFK
jgi:hypothetical protein